MVLMVQWQDFILFFFHFFSFFFLGFGNQIFQEPVGTLGGKLPAESAKYLPRVILGTAKKQLEKQRDEVGAAFCPVGHALELQNLQDLPPLLQALVSLPRLSRTLSLIILGMAKKQLEKGAR